MLRSSGGICTDATVTFYSIVDIAYVQLEFNRKKRSFFLVSLFSFYVIQKCTWIFCKLPQKDFLPLAHSLGEHFFLYTHTQGLGEQEATRDIDDDTPSPYIQYI